MLFQIVTFKLVIVRRYGRLYLLTFKSETIEKMWTIKIEKMKRVHVPVGKKAGEGVKVITNKSRWAVPYTVKRLSYQYYALEYKGSEEGYLLGFRTKRLPFYTSKRNAEVAAIEIYKHVLSERPDEWFKDLVGHDLGSREPIGEFSVVDLIIDELTNRNLTKQSEDEI